MDAHGFVSGGGGLDVGLKPKHQAFVAEYLTCWNATEAYRRVYPKSSDAAAASNGYKLLRNAEIAEAIRQHLQAKAMSAAEVVSLLSDQARADLGDYLSDNGEIDIAAMKAAKATKLLRKVKRTVRRGTTPAGGEWENETVEVELLNQQTALDMIAKAHGLYKQTVDIHHSGAVEITPDERAQAAKELEEWNERKRADATSNG